MRLIEVSYGVAQAIEGYGPGFFRVGPHLLRGASLVTPWDAGGRVTSQGACSSSKATETSNASPSLSTWKLDASRFSMVTPGSTMTPRAIHTLRPIRIGAASCPERRMAWSSPKR